MRFAIPLAAFALACSAPAFATGGFQCRPLSGAGPILTMSLGHHASARPLSVILQEGRRTLSTEGREAPLAVSQSWVDSSRLWLDLIDSNLTKREATLRAAFQAKKHYAVGTLVRGGKTYRVRCIEA